MKNSEILYFFLDMLCQYTLVLNRYVFVVVEVQ